MVTGQFQKSSWREGGVRAKNRKTRFESGREDENELFIAYRGGLTGLLPRIQSKKTRL